MTLNHACAKKEKLVKLDTAIILAGGPATRMKPFTNTAPKGMINVLGKPLLQWIIEWLREYEVRNIVLGVAYLKDEIIKYFRDGSEFGVNISYSVHTVDGGTGEGFRLAIQRHINQPDFFALNGDQITDLNLKDLASFHLKHHRVATMVLANPRCPFGHVLSDEEGNVTGFEEKPLCPATCNAGIYAFGKEILHHLPETGDVEKTTFPLLAKRRELKAYRFDGFFVTINTSKDLIEAEKEMRRLRI